jgi:hypothetical protein
MAVDHLVGDDPGLEDPPAFLISAALVQVIAVLPFGRVVPRARDPVVPASSSRWSPSQPCPLSG